MPRKTFSRLKIIAAVVASIIAVLACCSIAYIWTVWDDRTMPPTGVSAEDVVEGSAVDPFYISQAYVRYIGQETMELSDMPVPFEFLSWLAANDWVTTDVFVYDLCVDEDGPCTLYLMQVCEFGQQPPLVEGWSSAGSIYVRVKGGEESVPFAGCTGNEIDRDLPAIPSRQAFHTSIRDIFAI